MKKQFKLLFMAVCLVGFMAASCTAESVAPIDNSVPPTVADDPPTNGGPIIPPK